MYTSQILGAGVEVTGVQPASLLSGWLGLVSCFAE